MARNLILQRPSRHVGCFINSWNCFLCVSPQVSLTTFRNDVLVLRFSAGGKTAILLIHHGSIHPCSAMDLGAHRAGSIPHRRTGPLFDDGMGSGIGMGSWAQMLQLLDQSEESEGRSQCEESEGVSMARATATTSCRLLHQLSWENL